MNSHPEALPTKTSVKRTGKLLTIVYLIAIAVAMFGWIWAFVWVAATFAKWLLA